MRRSEFAHRERLRVPVRWWVIGTLMIASFWVAMVVALPPVLTWGITAVFLSLHAGALLWYGAAPIVVTGDELRVGRARIDRRFLGAVEPLDPLGMRATAGPLADARAYLVLRPYLAQGVRIEIVDPADPTPYWLVSSRRPAALARALSVASVTGAQGTLTEAPVRSATG